MRKETKSLLMIISIVFTLFTISSCSKKIEYVYEDAGSAFTTLREYLPYQEYVLDTTGTTHRKISKHKIAYEYYTLGREKSFKAYISDNVELGVRYYFRDKDKPSLLLPEEPIILTPVSSSNGIDEYLITKRDRLGADIVVVADKKTNYSIKVKAVFDKLGEDTYLIGEDGIRSGSTASLEGNNNVYYVEKDIDETIESNSENKYKLIEYNWFTNYLNKSHEFMNIFTDEEETTYVTVNEKYINTSDNKYKINIRKADEYNLEDIMDSEGNVYIDGDFNEWVVVNIPEDKNFNVSYNREGFAPYTLSLKYATRNNNYTKEIDCYKKWDESYGRIYSKKICIRRGTKYHFTEKKTLYLEIDGIEYKSMDVIPDLSLIKKASIYYYECENKVYPYARIYFYGLDICRIVKMNSADGSQEIVIPNDIDIKYFEISAQNVSSSFKVGDKLC